MEKIVIGIVSFVAGMIVMDALWGWKTGTARMVWNRIMRKN
jgi:hypothetical protein